MRRRLSYLTLALGTITVGLAVQMGRVIGSPVLRDITGDALWATMMVWWVSALTPQTRAVRRASIAIVICTLVETSQLLHTPWIDAVRDTRLGHLVLGSDFDGRDLAAYVAGVALALLIERALPVVVRHRATGDRTPSAP